jgi:hypothetical protein
MAAVKELQVQPGRSYRNAGSVVVAGSVANGRRRRWHAGHVDDQERGGLVAVVAELTA